MNKIIILATAAIMIFVASCGQNARKQKTTETAADAAQQPETVIPKEVTTPDFSTDKGITTYLTGTWKFADTRSDIENPGCTMIIAADLTVSLSFHHPRTKEDMGTYRGKITFDRFFASPREAPDLLCIRLNEPEKRDGGDYVFRHETVYDGKRVMKISLASNGNDFIFDRIEVNFTERDNGRDYIFEQETGEQSNTELRKESEFYAIYWGGNREWMWLDDVLPNAAAASILSISSENSTAKKYYRNEVKESVRYSVSSNADWNIGNWGMTKNGLYAIQTNRQGEVIRIRSAASCEDHSLVETFSIAYKMPDLFDVEDYARNIHIKCNQPVNGYNVEVFFIPENMIYDKITGPAKLVFINQKTGKKQQIISLYFAVPSKIFPDFEDLDSFAHGQTCNLDYGLPNDTDEWIAAHPLYYGALPFFFADVNFDGKQELLLTQFGQGQRGCSTYIVFSITPDGAFDDLLASQAPFDRLDDFSEIDRENRQIIIPYHNGASDSYSEIYKPDTNGKFYFVEKR